MALMNANREVMIEVKNLEKVYNADFCAVDDISFRLYQGEILGFLGPNGAGKSTTMNILLGMVKKTKGVISILGMDQEKQFSRIKKQIGYAPQDLVFYPYLTVLENVDAFANFYQIPNKQARIAELLDLVKLEEFKHKRAEQLSGGQKRRLNLILSVIHSPTILILDEPDAGMDPQSRAVLWDSIKKLAKENKISIILTTHLMEVVDRLSDRVYIIDHGKIIAEGSPSQLKAQYGNNEVIEIIFTENTPDELFTTIFELLQIQFPEFKLSKHESTISLSTANASTQILEIFDILKHKGFMGNVQNLQLRGNTLEDVFISLTGKKLRE